MVAQVFEQLLAVLAFAAAPGEVVFAQDHVVGTALQLADGGIGIDRIFDLADARQVEHILQAGAHSLVGIDHQHRQVSILLHRRSRFVPCEAPQGASASEYCLP